MWALRAGRNFRPAIVVHYAPAGTPSIVDGRWDRPIASSVGIPSSRQVDRRFRFRFRLRFLADRASVNEGALRCLGTPQDVDGILRIQPRQTARQGQGAQDIVLSHGKNHDLTRALFRLSQLNRTTGSSRHNGRTGRLLTQHGDFERPRFLETDQNAFAPLLQQTCVGRVGPANHVFDLRDGHSADHDGADLRERNRAIFPYRNGISQRRMNF